MEINVTLKPQQPLDQSANGTFVYVDEATHGFELKHDGKSVRMYQGDQLMTEEFSKLTIVNDSNEVNTIKLRFGFGQLVPKTNIAGQSVDINGQTTKLEQNIELSDRSVEAIAWHIANTPTNRPAGAPYDPTDVATGSM